MPSDVKLMPHRHHEDRVYTVISGVFYVGVGAQFDEGKLQTFSPGADWCDRPAFGVSGWRIRGRRHLPIRSVPTPAGIGTL